MKVASLADIDALVAEYVTHEQPEVHWEDSHALFRFATEEEALNAIRDPYYQLFLPNVDWSMTKVVKVQIYRPYSTDLDTAWRIVEQISDLKNGLQMQRHMGRWIACFGNAMPSVARTAPLAICLAGLRCCGVEIDIDTDQLL